MPIDVATTPAVARVEGRVCIVIDALRATSTLATIFGRGAARVAVAPTIDAARELRGRTPESLLCGEAGGLPPVGFDFGNSPVEMEAQQLADRTLVMATSNGTRALAAVSSARAVFTGALPNLTACADAALRAANGLPEVTMVCAGNDHGAVFSLEDFVVAGAFVQRIQSLLGGDAPRGLAQPAARTDTATAALHLWNQYADDPRSAFADAIHGQHLLRLGLELDFYACAWVDRYAVAPHLRPSTDGTLWLTDAAIIQQTG